MTDELFFDTDCLSAFLWINDTNILHELYGGRIVLPEPVYQELSNPGIPHIKQRADIMINNKDASVKTIDTSTEEYKLYVELVRGKKGQKSTKFFSFIQGFLALKRYSKGVNPQTTKNIEKEHDHYEHSY